MSEWKTIDSAPKDLAWSGGGQNYGQRILAHDPRQQDALRCRWWWSDSGASNFIADGGFAVHPTHWMPLPPPPAT